MTLSLIFAGRRRLACLRAQVDDAAAASECPLDELAAMSEYAVHDAKVIDDGKAIEQGKDAPGKVDALDIRKAYDRAERLKFIGKDRLFKMTITPHWFDNNTRFWYRNDLKGGKKEFVLVDADKGTRTTRRSITPSSRPVWPRRPAPKSPRTVCRSTPSSSGIRPRSSASAPTR